MNKALLAPGFGPAALAEARAMIGKIFRIEQWNYEASRDVIRHYAWGIGDDNPLFCDPDYAAASGGVASSHRRLFFMAFLTLSSRRAFPISNGSIPAPTGPSVSRCVATTKLPLKQRWPMRARWAATRSRR